MFVRLGVAAETACDGASAASDFATASEAGEAAFAAMESDSLLAALDAAAAALACLPTPVDPRDAAAYHRLLAIAAFTRHDFSTALSEFHAARRLEPGYAIPESVAPAGHPLVGLYDASLRSDEGELEPVQAVGGGMILVDGVRGAPRPTGVSVILQRFDAAGNPEASTLLRPGEPLPAWAVPPKALSRKGLHTGLIAGTGAAAVASAVLYGLALGAHDQFWDLDDPAADSELPGLQAQANTLTYASIGSGAVALGLGAVTVFTW